MYPEILNKTIESFKKFNGIGEKTAERLALSVFDMSSEEVEIFSKNITELKNSIVRCKVCGHITENEKCNICLNDYRNDNIICVVEDYKSVFMFEKSGSFTGKYHVLNGLISPIDGVYPEDINISTLLDRIKDDLDDAEVILALKPSIEGETTTLYIKKIFENKNIKVSRLSYGIPMGVEIDYLDSITLDRALLDRKEIS